ncbi:centromere protein T [Phyllobates terribilis]|uniref:centromere protein T n=1 Tax=Phyllobates terribilis TaxID=111132 RepID=UPI003CCAF870
MEGSLTDNLTTRSLLKGILATEPVRTAVKNPSKRGNPQASTSYAHQAEIPSSPSMNLRSKMKERLRRSLQRSGAESPVLKRKVDTNSRAKVKSPRKGSLPLMEELDDITPRTLLKKIIQNEDEVSLVVSQRSKAPAAEDDRNLENSPTAQLSGVGNVNLSLPELEDSEYVTIMRKTGKKRKLRVSEFEREVDKRLPVNNDNDNVSLDSFASSSSRVSSYTLSRPLETKLDLSAVPESTFRKVLLRRPNKVCLVSVDDFEQGVDNKYQLLKGSQECFTQPDEEDRSEASSNNLALMDTELYTHSLRKDANTPKSEKRKQSGTSKLFLSAQDEIKEANGQRLERGTRKLKANDHPTEENVIVDFRGDHGKVIENRDGGEDSEEDGEDNAVRVSDEVMDDSSEDEADDGRDAGEDGADVVHGSGEVADDSSEDEANDGHASGDDEVDDGHASGEDRADVVYGSGRVADDSSEDEVDDGRDAGEDGADVVHGSGEVADDSSEDEANDGHASGDDEVDDGHASGEDRADVVYGSGRVADDRSEDEVDDGRDAGEDGADVVHGSGEVADDSSEDEANDGHASGDDEVDDGHASGEDRADVVYGSGGVADDSSEDEVDDGHASGEDRADVYGSGGVADGHASGEDRADVVYGSGGVADDSSEDEVDDGHASGEDRADVYGSGGVADGHASGEDRADVVYGSGGVADDSSEDEVDDGHASGEDRADVVYGSGEDEDNSDEDKADDGNAGEVEDDSDEADDVHVEAKVADDLTDDESNMQPNKSSVTHHNRKSAGLADYSHPEQRARLRSRLSDGNMKTAESIHLQSVSVSRLEDSSALLETTGDESLDLAMAREFKKVENNQLILEELPEPPSYLKSVCFARTDKPAPVCKKIQRKKSTKPKKSGSGLKSSQVKQIFNHHAQGRVSKEAFTDVEKCIDVYMNQLASDLSAYTSHAKRTRISRADVELLMKRQRLVTDTTSLNVLIEKHLPLDCRRLLIPCAMSGNQVLPKISASSRKKL